MAALDDNKRVTLEFLHLAFNEGKMEEAVDRYIDARCIKHSAQVGLGPEGLVDRGTWTVRSHFHVRHAVTRIIAEGDLVAVHSLVTFSSDDLGTAVVDIFRLKHGKIVEHWDVWDVVKLVPSELAAGDVTRASYFRRIGSRGRLARGQRNSRAVVPRGRSFTASWSRASTSWRSDR
jgi:predicted SnoaL-like aldol condensation-catalyzing enzyme